MKDWEKDEYGFNVKLRSEWSGNLKNPEITVILNDFILKKATRRLTHKRIEDLLSAQKKELVKVLEGLKRPTFRYTREERKLAYRLEDKASIPCVESMDYMRIDTWNRAIAAAIKEIDEK